jgi:hypothetical protein
MNFTVLRFSVCYFLIVLAVPTFAQNTVEELYDWGNNYWSSVPSMYNTNLGGDGAFEDNTTGSGNTAGGHVSLTENTDGNANTAIGSETLSDNTSGSYNSAFEHCNRNR